MKIELFLFTSKSITNIWAGIGARTWAVAVSETSPARNLDSVTKSKRMRAGSLGLLYCSEIHSFTTPFMVSSKPDTSKIITDVWPEHWQLSFRILPLGNPTRLVHKDKAKQEWRVLKNSGKNNITFVLNITATTVFIPSQIDPEDWEIILKDVAV